MLAKAAMVIQELACTQPLRVATTILHFSAFWRWLPACMRGTYVTWHVAEANLNGFVALCSWIASSKCTHKTSFMPTLAVSKTQSRQPIWPCRPRPLSDCAWWQLCCNEKRRRAQGVDARIQIRIRVNAHYFSCSTGNIASMLMSTKKTGAIESEIHDMLI